MAATSALLAQPLGVNVVERGMYYRNWQWIQTATDASGQVALKTNAWTELGNGLCYLDENGQWQDSQDLIELDPATGGAVAQRGPTKVRFSANATAPVVIDITTATGQRLQGRISSLHYFDAASGKEATIATVKDSVGILYAPNTLVYPDAFDNLKCDIRYVYDKGALAQDLALLAGQTLPAPAEYGLDPLTTRLQVWTLWSAAPLPSVRQVPLQKEADPQKRASMVSPDLVDDLLDFEAGDGGLWFPVGAAFRWDGGAEVSSDAPVQLRVPDPSDPNLVLVGKHWVPNATGNGATLIESANLRDLAPKLAAAGITVAGRSTAEGRVTPLSAAGATSGSDQRSGRTGTMPQPISGSPSLLVSARPYRASGLLWDYVIVNGTVGSYTFTNGTTFLITNSFDVGSQATFEANTCIKYASNAWLIVAGGVSFPSTGTKPVFTSKDDNAYGQALPSGTNLTQSTGVPTNAASQALWMYYESSYTQVRNARFRWAQRGIQYDENSGVSVSPALSSSSFENSKIGIYVNLPSDTLYLTSVITCNVTTPIYDYAGYYSGTTTPSANVVNASAMLGGQAETTVAINPANPAKVAVLSVQSGALDNNNQPGLFCAYTSDGGASWTTNLIATTNQNLIPAAFGDPSASFDQFGNLFVAYVDFPSATNVVVALSTDGGASFPALLATFPNPYGGQSTYGTDSPRVIAGAAPSGGASTGSVWVVFGSSGPSGWSANDCTNFVSFAVVTGLGTNNIKAFSTPQELPSSSGTWYPNIALGANGEVAASFVVPTNSTNSSIYLTVNTNGIYSPQWTSPIDVVDSNLPKIDKIAPDPSRGIAQSGRLAFDLSGKYPHRLYLVYTDCPTNNTNNTLIKLAYSTDYGSSWSSVTKLNDDNNSLAHFLPAIAADPVSGNVAVFWYDCRNDSNNSLTQCYGTVSRNGAAAGSFGSNFQVCPGRSNAPQVGIAHRFGYGDYTGLSYFGNIFRFAWADNSNNSAVQPPNPNSPNSAGVYPMNIYITTFGY